jgi:hypothetical protein
MIQIKEFLEAGKPVFVAMRDEVDLTRFKDRLKRYEIECEIMEFWDPTKDGLSSRGHMGHVYDELTGETYLTPPEPPRLRGITLKPKSTNP